MNSQKPETQLRSPFRLSATVLLLRHNQGKIEVLLTRRRADMRFMAGVWVYPGGVVESADASAQAGECLTRTVRETLGLLVAAVRETFEEVGLLLARDAQGMPCDPALAEHLQGERAAVRADASAFPQLLARNGLRIDGDALVHWAHWITPSTYSRRFDTHFFTTPAPAGQSVHVDASEADDWRWQEPRAALAANERKELPLAPPTRQTLREIAESFETYGSLNAMLAAEATREVPTIMPKIITDQEGEQTLMPWHLQYADAPGEGVPPGTHYPERVRRLPDILKRDPQYDA